MLSETRIGLHPDEVLWIEMTYKPISLQTTHWQWFRKRTHFNLALLSRFQYFCHESKHDMSLHISNSFTQTSRLSWLSIFPMGSIDICSNSHETTFASLQFYTEEDPILTRLWIVGPGTTTHFGQGGGCFLELQVLGGTKVMVRGRGVCGGSQKY